MQLFNLCFNYAFNHIKQMDNIFPLYVKLWIHGRRHNVTRPLFLPQFDIIPCIYRLSQIERNPHELLMYVL